MSDTPETDAFAVKFKTTCGEKYWVPVDCSRKLERERDEARADLEFRRGLYKVQEQYLETARRERDESREELNRYKRQWEESRSENVEDTK